MDFVSATRAKVIRAEPVAALYEQGKVHPVGMLAALEDQLCAFCAGGQEGSPDRVDALVWGPTEFGLAKRSGGYVLRIHYEVTSWKA